MQRWCQAITSNGDLLATAIAMQGVNPAIPWREWLIAPAYVQAARGDPSLVLELQQAFSQPYSDPATPLVSQLSQRKPLEFFNAGGISPYSCSS